MSRQKIAKDVPNFGQIGEISPNLVTLIPERFAFRRRRLIPVRSSVQPKTIIRWNWKKFLQTFFRKHSRIQRFYNRIKGVKYSGQKIPIQHLPFSVDNNAAASISKRALARKKISDIEKLWQQVSTFVWLCKNLNFKWEAEGVLLLCVASTI